MTSLISRRRVLANGFAAALAWRSSQTEFLKQESKAPEPNAPPNNNPQTLPEKSPDTQPENSDDIVLIARTSKNIAIILTQDDDNAPLPSAKHDTYCGIGIAQHILVSEDKSSAAPYYELGAMFINQDDCTVTAYGLKGLKRSVGLGHEKHPDAEKALHALRHAAVIIQESPDLINQMQDYSNLVGVRSCRPSQEARRSFLQRFIMT